MRYCYSLDNINFNSGIYDTEVAARIAAEKEVLSIEATVGPVDEPYNRFVYVAEAIPQVGGSFAPTAEDLINFMVERAHDEIGEAAEDWLDGVPENAELCIQEQLDLLFDEGGKQGSWFELYGLQPHFYAVGKVKQFTIPIPRYVKGSVKGGRKK